MLARQLLIRYAALLRCFAIHAADAAAAIERHAMLPSCRCVHIRYDCDAAMLRLPRHSGRVAIYFDYAEFMPPRAAITLPPDAIDTPRLPLLTPLDVAAACR